MFSRLAIAAVLLTAIVLPCHAQSAVDAVALTQWGASAAKPNYYKLLKRTPTSIEFKQLSENYPAELKVEEIASCKFKISYFEPKYSSAYVGTLDFSTAQWPQLLTTDKKRSDGTVAYQVVHVPGARYCHISGFLTADYNVAPGACQDLASFNLNAESVNGIRSLRLFCPGSH